MEYKVRITLKEIYEVWVEATDEDNAEVKAIQALNDGKAEIVNDSLEAEVVEPDEED